MLRKLLVFVALFGSLSVAEAKTMKLTIYDDGISCPAGCDAHFVMNSADNGGINAFQPGSTRASPQKCKVNEACNICFGAPDNTCMTATYRGGGPPVSTFDFTPNFYKEHCGKPGIPAALAAQCKALDNAVAKLAYDKRVNCFEAPQNPKCSSIMAKANVEQAADVPKRQKCLEDGEAAYNNAQSDPEERRTNGCNYTLLRLGGTPKKRWHKLLPAACRSGTYVDQFGLDCCSSDVRFAASNHPECAAYFPR